MARSGPVVIPEGLPSAELVQFVMTPEVVMSMSRDLSMSIVTLEFSDRVSVGQALPQSGMDRR